MFEVFEIRQIPLSLGSERSRVERFLFRNGLRLEEMDYYAGVFNCEDELLGGGGYKANVLKCIAIDGCLREAQMGSKLISHLVNQVLNASDTVRCFTKPSNLDIFQSLGFRLIAQSPQALLMEMGDRLSKYKKYLESLKRPGRNGAIVMNCNPFSRGHRYLIEKAAAKVDNLYIIMVGEDKSQFSAEERFRMLSDGCADLNNLTVCRGSEYAVSAFTFPSYFIKEVSDIAPAQIKLDLDIFAKHIAPSLGVSVRFVGSEPTDALTSLYNRMMASNLTANGIEVAEIERLEENGAAISASRIRKAISEMKLDEALNMAAAVSAPYIMGQAAANALRLELELTPKPGLIDAGNSGAHSDMSYKTMLRSIDALRPYFVRLAVLGYSPKHPEMKEVAALGIEAEKAMFAATGGVNTHKGALFSLGLMTVVAARLLYTESRIDACSLQQGICSLTKNFPAADKTHGSDVRSRYGLKGALEMAQEGYAPLFSVWRPFLADSKDPHRCLLLIMSTLDDTNICHRSGLE